MELCFKSWEVRLQRSRVTIREVAAQAGVSHQTVSRVINNSERVTPETRARVNAAIQELNYNINAVARSMARGQTCTLACLSPNLTDYTFASIIEGAETEARQHDYFILAASAPDGQTFASLIDSLVSSRRAEALMVINPYTDERYTLIPDGVPLVYVGAQPRHGKAASVAMDDQDLAHQAISHLVSLGHRQIAQITGPLEEDCSQDRNAGFEAVLLEHGIQVDPALTLEGDWSATSGFHAVQQLLENHSHFSAIFAQNDRMAVGAIRALHHAGLHVPGDISVIGVDDMPLASYFDPPLTTMRQDTYGIGREAARLLIHAVEHSEEPLHSILIPAELVVRGSTGSPSSGL